MRFRHAGGEMTTDRCLVMGIVNRTPDSFYDGGRMDLHASVAFAVRLVEEGADLLDVGGVKAGPGPPVSEGQEVERLVPLVEAIADATSTPISVETSRGSVARLAIEAGAVLINDVTSLAETDLAEACAETGAGLVVMHHGGQIRGRPRHPRYDDVVSDVLELWDGVAEKARSFGVAQDALLFDPGLDFGKNTY